MAERHIVYKLREVFMGVLVTKQLCFFRQQPDVHLQPFKQRKLRQHAISWRSSSYKQAN